MMRGEVWWVDFNPSMGSEIQKVRPAIIISNDASNRAISRVQVVPVTSNISKCYPCEAYVEINGKMSKAMADQIATVSKLRLKTQVGKLSFQDMLEVERAIKVQFAL